MRRLRLALPLALLASASCVSHAPGSDPDAGPDLLPGAIASMLVEVDPAADPPMRVIAPASSEKPSRSVLGDVSLVGPGTWNPATERLSATVRITNRSGAELDEPFMELVSLNRAEVRAELIHEGAGGAGSRWRFADLDRAAGRNGGSARQRIRFHAPGAVPFTFRVDVVADPESASPVDPDDDDDMYNAELNQAAGDDCDDEDPSVRPRKGGCLCHEACDACSESECCRQACSGDCACPSTCSCEYEGEPGTPDVECVGATCDLTCDGHVGQCTIGECTGADCGLTCERSAAVCTVDSCSDSSCAAECTSSLAVCRMNECVDGAACSLACGSSGAICRVGACEGSTCDVACDRVIGPCGIASCAESDCHVTCDRSLTTCSIDRCDSGTCTVECASSLGCRMSCDDDAECRMRCTGGGACNLTCDAGAPIACGNGWRVCPGTPCP